MNEDRDLIFSELTRSKNKNVGSTSCSALKTDGRGKKDSKSNSN